MEERNILKRCKFGMRLRRRQVSSESIRIVRNSITILEIKKIDVLNYVWSQLSRKKRFPQLRLETFLPQAQEFLQNIKGFDSQERSSLRNEYSELIKKILSDLERDREIVITYRDVFMGRAPIIEVYDYRKSKFKEVPPDKTKKEEEEVEGEITLYNVFKVCFVMIFMLILSGILICLVYLLLP